MKTLVVLGAVTLLVFLGLAAAPVQASPVPTVTLVAAATGPVEVGGNPDVTKGTEHPEAIHPDRIHRALMTAATAPWAVKDQETQKLLDKLISDRKAMLDSEKSRLGDYEKLSKAGRDGDTKAISKAQDDLKAATDKVRNDVATVKDDLKALEEQMKKIRPEGAKEK